MSDLLFTPPEPEGALGPPEPRLASPETAIKDASYGEILRLAIPLILSSTGMMIMHTVDSIFLTHYSKQALAASGPGSFSSWLAICLFVGTAGYTSSMVAQYVGANKNSRVGAIVWQGMYFSLIFGACVSVLSLISEDVFRWAGHPPELVPLEAQFFRATCLGAPAFLLNSALSGYFSGRGDNKPMMVVQIFGLIANGVFSYALIFGKFGFPEWGVAGAAWATVFAQIIIFVCLFLLFFFGKGHDTYCTRTGTHLDWKLLRRLVHFGLPAGFRFWIEILAWTSFMIFMGRIGTLEVASTTLGFRINGMAFFPVIGMTQAIGVLVGQAQGQGRPDLALRGTWRGGTIVIAYMTFASYMFWFHPEMLCRLFLDEAHSPYQLAFQGLLMETLINLLKYVAIYSLLDGVNLTIVSALQGAGDTRWTMVVSSALHIAFIALLAVMDHLHYGLYAQWVAATIFIMSQAAVWLYRFLGGHWKTIKVVESEPVALD